MTKHESLALSNVFCARTQFRSIALRTGAVRAILSPGLLLPCLTLLDSAILRAKAEVSLCCITLRPGNSQTLNSIEEVLQKCIAFQFVFNFSTHAQPDSPGQEIVHFPRNFITLASRCPSLSIECPFYWCKLPDRYADVRFDSACYGTRHWKIPWKNKCGTQRVSVKARISSHLSLKCVFEIPM